MKNPYYVGLSLATAAFVAILLFVVAVPRLGSRESEPVAKTLIITNANEVVQPVWVSIPQEKYRMTMVNGHCQSNLVQATAISADGRIIDNSLVSWSSSDSTRLKIDQQGVTQFVACDAVGMKIDIRAQVAPSVRVKAPTPAPKAGVKS